MNHHPSPSSQTGQINLMFVLIGLLAVSTVALAGVSVYGFSKANTATTTLEAAKAKSAAAAAAAQKAVDEKAAQAANELPYRSYNAPQALGSFQINFPKNWSAYVTEQVNGTPQIVLNLNPEFVKSSGASAAILDPQAVRVTLLRQLTTEVVKPFADAVKKGTIKEQAVTVSGIAGTQYTGALPDRRSVRAVYLPVRDKTLVFSTENAQYAAQFDQILAQAKINP